MTLKDTQNSYGNISKLNHWLIGLMMIGMLVSGIIMVDMPKGPEKGELYGLHKSFGFAVLVLASWRIIWRIRMGFPKAVQGVKKWEIIAAHATHGILLLATIGMPLSGIIMSLAGGYPVVVFDLFTLAPFETKDPFIGGISNAIHNYGGKVLIAVIIIHILAAFKHHFINKDKTLIRMTTGK